MHQTEGAYNRKLRDRCAIIIKASFKERLLKQN